MTLIVLLTPLLKVELVRGFSFTLTLIAIRWHVLLVVVVGFVRRGDAASITALVGEELLGEGKVSCAR